MFPRLELPIVTDLTQHTMYGKRMSDEAKME